MSSLLVYGGTSTVVFEEEPVIRQPVSDESVARLLVNLDVSNRSESANISETIRTMLEYAIRDGENERGVIKNAILVAFRRRNHQKSKADGEGDGEKALFLAILKAIISFEKYNDLVLSVLPLVPVYGSWRDLLMLGEELCLLNEAAGPENPIVEAICRLFAQQLLEDDAGLTAELAASEAESAEKANESGPKTKRKRFTPSNACKYAPHETRHDAAKKESETTAVPDATAGRTGGGRGGAGRGRGRGRGRGGRGTAAASIPPTSEEIRNRHKANKRMSLLIARHMFVPAESSSDIVSDVQLLVRFRKLRVRLNTILTERGHLVEPLMIQKKAARINFFAANKGSLVKYQKSINKDTIAASRWKRAMQKNLAAVPDIDSLIVAASQCLQEVQMADETETQNEQLLLSLRAKKAIVYLNERLKEIRQKAKSLKAASTVNSDVAGTETSSSEAEEDVLRQIIIVDTCLANDETARLALLLSAVLLSIVQESAFLVVDGNLLQLTGNEDFTNAVQIDALGHWLIRYMRQYLSSAAIDGKNACFQRMQEALRLALKQGFVPGEADTHVYDVLCLCMHFAVYDESSEEFQEMLLQLQQPATDRHQLRTFRVHRLKGAVSPCMEEVPHELSTHFVPRPADRRLTPLPVDASKLTADVLFLVDFTGSMGSWMESVKRELVSLLEEIQQSSRMRQVRVALVGYRDYQDTGRVVTVDFKVQADAHEIVAELQRQSASGGGDTPEDLLSGLKAATELDWQSMLRFCVLITDAPAHGMCERSFDDHHSGYCPDQILTDGYPTFAQCMQRLAVDLEVDTFFCILTPSVDLMSQTVSAVKAPYSINFGDAGFGTVSLLGNARTKFREQLVAQISAAIANSIVTKDLQGLQSCDGQTLSSLCQSLLQPVRQSMQGSAVDLATSTVTTAATAESTTATAAATKEKAKKEEKDKIASSESDWQRLQRDLRQASLYPVRLALGMPVHIAATATEEVKAQTEACPSLTALSCDALYRAGLTVEMMQQHDYPEQLIDSFQKHLAAKLAVLS